MDLLTLEVLHQLRVFDAARAVAYARGAEAAVMRGDSPGPLSGVPFSVKDLVNTAGVRTTFGSVALADNVPPTDSVAVARLKRTGAILIGGASGVATR